MRTKIIFLKRNKESTSHQHKQIGKKRSRHTIEQNQTDKRRRRKKEQGVEEREKEEQKEQSERQTLNPPSRSRLPPISSVRPSGTGNALLLPPSPHNNTRETQENEKKDGKKQEGKTTEEKKRKERKRKRDTEEEEEREKGSERNTPLRFPTIPLFLSLPVPSVCPVAFLPIPFLPPSPPPQQMFALTDDCGAIFWGGGTVRACVHTHAPQTHDTLSLVTHSLTTFLVPVPRCQR